MRVKIYDLKFHQLVIAFIALPLRG